MFKHFVLVSSITIFALAFCMEKDDISNFTVCGTTYSQNDDNSYSMTVPTYESNDAFEQRMDNIISNYQMPEPMAIAYGNDEDKK